MAVGDAQIDPDDLEHFAKRMKEIADDLADEARPCSKLVKASIENSPMDFPAAGVFESGDAFRQAYEGKIDPMFQAFRTLKDLVEQLGETTKKVAEQYRSTEELNSAKAKQIEEMLGAATEPEGGSQQPTSDSQPSPT